MTRDPDLIGLIEGYLDDVEGHTPLPDATRDAIRARLPSIHQRPAWWPGWRSLDMNTVMKYGLGAAAAVFVGFLGVQLLTSDGDIGGPSEQSPSVSPATQDEAPAGCGFPPGTSLAFAGESSLDEAGLTLPDDPGKDRRGDLYVTADVIKVDYDARSDRRRYCLIFPRHAGQFFGDLAMGPVPRDWAPVAVGSPIPSAEEGQP